MSAPGGSLVPIPERFARSHQVSRGTSPRRALAQALLLAIAAWPGLCNAHGVQDGEGFASGLLHPVFGFDHLLAMVGVGAVSAQLGGRSLWGVPLAFVIAMAIGGALGMANLPLPLREVGIALSVVFVGLAVAVVSRGTVPAWAFAGVMFFGLCHGHAHGVEMPRSASPVFYAFGFLTSTTVLHVAGLVLGELSTRAERPARWLRFGGAATVLLGLGFLAGWRPG